MSTTRSKFFKKEMKVSTIAIAAFLVAVATALGLGIGLGVSLSNLQASQNADREVLVETRSRAATQEAILAELLPIRHVQCCK